MVDSLDGLDLRPLRRDFGDSLHELDRPAARPDHRKNAAAIFVKRINPQRHAHDADRLTRGRNSLKERNFFRPTAGGLPNSLAICFVGTKVRVSWLSTIRICFSPVAPTPFNGSAATEPMARVPFEDHAVFQRDRVGTGLNHRQTQHTQGRNPHQNPPRTTSFAP